MNKIIVQEGMKYSLPTLIEDLQSFIQQNTIDRFKPAFESFGVHAELSGLFMSPSDFSLKVTGVGVGWASVASGSGLTEAFNYICVPSGITIPLPASAGTSTLYVQHSGVHSDYVNQQSGFYFNETGVNLLSTATRERDGYRLIWDRNPGISGIVLADVVYSGSTISSISDRRSENVLKLKVDEFLDTAIRKDTAKLQTMLSGITTPYAVVSEGVHSLTLSPGTAGIQNVTSDDIVVWLEKTHTQNTDTSTTSPEYRVGVGTLGTLLTGLPIKTVEDPPLPPLNFRVTDVFSPSLMQAPASETVGLLSLGLRQAPFKAISNVVIEWDWDDITGTGGNGVFTVTNSPEFKEDDLVGYFLYFVANGKVYDLAIIANDATIVATDSTKPRILGTSAVQPGDRKVEPNPEVRTVLTVKTRDLKDINLTGVSIDHTRTGFLYTDATEFEIVAIAVSGSVKTLSTPKTARIRHSDNGPLLVTTMPLEVGVKYKLFIRAFRKELYSNWVEMRPGYYIKDSVIYETLENTGIIQYGNPFLVMFPRLRLDGVTLVGEPTRSGFKVTVNDGGRWDGIPDEYELVCARLPEAADFLNVDHLKKYSASKEISVDVTEDGAFKTYDVKVRPLAGAMSLVNGYLETQTDSGYNGVLPDELPLISFHLNLTTYKANLFTTNTAFTYKIVSEDDARIWSPAIATGPADVTNRVLTIDTLVVGSVITVDPDNSHGKRGYGRITGYVVNSGVRDNAVYDFKTVTISGLAPLVNTLPNTQLYWEINTSEYGRLGYTMSSGLNADYQITGVTVDCDYPIDGEDVTMRLYQQGTAAYERLLLSEGTTDGTFQTTTQILGERNGVEKERKLIIDFYDDINGKNRGIFRGKVMVFGKPLNNTRA